MLDCELIGIEDPRWSQVLSECRHDIYHLPDYAKLEAEWIDARPAAFVAREDQAVMFIPLLVRRIPDSAHSDAVTPYGYSPPVVSPGVSVDFLQQALTAFDGIAREQGIVSTFMRLHPLLKNSLVVPPALSRWIEIERGQTVDMPLDDDGETWERGLAKGQRYDLRRLRREGCTVEIDSDEAWAAFPAIYRQTMERIGASPGYFYSDAYLQAFRQSLSDHALCAMVRDEAGQVKCAAIFTRVGELVQYHLSGTVDEHARLAPTKLLLAAMREWCRDNGIKAFHLGGGFGGGTDTLFNFKRRFGGKVYAFHTVSAVHDAPAFDRLCAQWLASSDRELPGPEGFFPPYRAPLKVAA